MIRTAPVGRPACRHRPLGILEIHDPRADLGIEPSGTWTLAEPGVEALRDVARELEVLALVVADGNDVGLVEEDVPAISTG